MSTLDQNNYNDPIVRSAWTRRQQDLALIRDHLTEPTEPEPEETDVG